MQVRNQKGLPALVAVLKNSDNSVVNTVSLALRNLCQETQTFDLLGRHALPSIVDCLYSEPSSPLQLRQSQSLSHLDTIDVGGRQNRLNCRCLTALLDLCVIILEVNPKFIR